MNPALCLAESGAFPVPPDARVISLTPAASWEFLKKGIPYGLLTDPDSEAELRRDEDSLYDEQLRWFAEVDELIAREVPETARWKPGLVRLHTNRLKYLLDDMILKARALDALLKKEKPARLLLISAPSKAPSAPSLYNLRHPDRMSVRGVLQCFDPARYGFALELSAVENGPEFLPASQAPVSGFRGILKSLYRFLHYRRYRTRAGVSGKPAFLFLDAGVWAVDEVIRELLEQGYPLLIKNGTRITEFSGWCEKSYDLQTETSATELLTRGFARALAAFEESDLPRRAEAGSPVPLGSLLRPFFRDLFLTELPAVAGETLALEKLLCSRPFAAVVSRATAGRNYPAALAAARASGVPRVCFQHSVGALDMRDWVDDELAFSDLNYALCPDSADYFRSCAREYPDCRVQESSHYLNHVAGQVPRRTSRSAKLRVLYVPAKQALGLTHFNTFFYPLPWYFEHQRAMLDLFGSLGEYAVRYKHTPGQEWADQCLLPYIAGRRYTNVEVVKGLLTDYLGEADRVIMDYPSTGLFESAACGVPVLVLTHQSMKVWEPFTQVMGRSLARFSTREQAHQQVRSFLSSDPELYRPSIRLGAANPGKSLLHDLSRLNFRSPVVQEHTS